MRRGRLYLWLLCIISPSSSAYCQEVPPSRGSLEVLKLSPADKEPILKHFSGHPELPVAIVFSRKDGSKTALLGIPSERSISEPVILGLASTGEVIWTKFAPIEPNWTNEPFAFDRNKDDLLLAWAAPVRNCGDKSRIHAKAIDRRTGETQWCTVVAKDSVVSLSVFSWEGVGWVIPFTTTGPAGAAGRMGVQLLDLDGNNLLGKMGITLGKNGCPFGENPVLGLRDSDKSFMLLWHDYESVSYVALRIDANGKYLWKSPARVCDGSEDYLRRKEFNQIKLKADRTHGVVATLYAGVASDVMEDLDEVTVAISKDGKAEVLKRRKVREE